MLFNSRVFLFAFLPVAYFVFWKLASRQMRYLWLTVAGYVFYSFWNYRFCAIMAFSTLVSYLAGIGFLHFQDRLRRKLCLIVPIVVDLSLLSFFKYLGIWKFVLSSGEWLASLWGMDTASSLLWKFHLHSVLWSRDFLVGALLPVGISFYTLHTISYIVDSYRGTIKPTTNIFEFACYVALFPQLVAGPIVRFRQVEGDLEHINAANRRAGLDIGWSYFVIGLIKKVLVADTIAGWYLARLELDFSGMGCLSRRVIDLLQNLQRILGRSAPTLPPQGASPIQVHPVLTMQFSWGILSDSGFNNQSVQLWARKSHFAPDCPHTMRVGWDGLSARLS